MNRYNYIRKLIREVGKVEAKKRFQRMANFEYDGVNLDHLGDGVKDIIEEAVVSIGVRGLEYLKEHKNLNPIYENVKPNKLTNKNRNVEKY